MEHKCIAPHTQRPTAANPHVCLVHIHTKHKQSHSFYERGRERKPCMIWVYGFYEQLHRAGYHQQWHNFPQALHYQTNQCFPFWILSNHLQQSHLNILKMLPEISERITLPNSSICNRYWDVKRGSAMVLVWKLQFFSNKKKRGGGGITKKQAGYITKK